MDKPSMKKEIIRFINDISSLGKEDLKNGGSIDFSGNLLIVVTAGCIITGRSWDEENIVSEDGSNQLSSQFLSKCVNKVANSYREEFKIEDRLAGNDGCFILRDVTVQYPGQFTVKFAELTIFYDQVLAISIGNTE